MRRLEKKQYHSSFKISLSCVELHLERQNEGHTQITTSVDKTNTSGNVEKGAEN